MTQTQFITYLAGLGLSLFALALMIAGGIADAWWARIETRVLWAFARKTPKWYYAIDLLFFFVGLLTHGRGLQWIRQYIGDFPSGDQWLIAQELLIPWSGVYLFLRLVGGALNMTDEAERAFFVEGGPQTNHRKNFVMGLTGFTLMLAIIAIDTLSKYSLWSGPEWIKSVAQWSLLAVMMAWLFANWFDRDRE